MAENVLALKKLAVAAGMDKKEAMKADRKTLEAFLSKSSKPAKKKSGGVAKKKKSGKPERKQTGRKNTSTKKDDKKISKPKLARKSNKPKSGKKSSNGDGRHLIESLDFSETDGWNPRPGSPVERIFKMLKKCKGNVEKATDALMPNVKEYVSTTKEDGSRRSKDEMRAALRYRVNRTKWQFAIQTGQHEPSANRVKYGTGDYASGNSKPKSKKSKPKTQSKGKSSKKKSSASSKKSTKSTKKSKRKSGR